ncbi:MAG TPA: hypothetical protein VHC48_00540 [Puia sp.]|nr:hypothetical protein [Puia sp.]
MLNLSDNELDRLSREAASQHDPGDPLGPQAWERLEVRLDKELGRAGPDVSRGLRGIRRLPFQYAPVILLIVGVSYYAVKQARGRKADNSGGPPLTVVKTPQPQGTMTSDSSLNNRAYSDNSTPYSQDQSQNIDSAAAAPGATATAPANTGVSSGSGTNPSGAVASNNNAGTHNRPRNPLTSRNLPTPGTNGAAHDAATDNTITHNTIAPNTTTHNARAHNSITHNNNTSTRNHPHHTNTTPGQNRPATNLTAGSPAQSEPSGPEKTFIQHPRGLPRNHPTISDSALRAIAAQTPVNPGKKSSPSLRIDRSLTFGLQVAPDFSSVNSLAGDKAGSSIGFTVDYQFANRLRIGSGLFLTKKIYTARASDYHVPDAPGPNDYYRSIGIYNHVDFVKGSMTMLEIPLTLRYDFSVTGNTVFFASGGLSTYLFGNEDCRYYYFSPFVGQEVHKGLQYSNKPGIFSTANLSLGVETGISNDLSIMLAPYMKLPVSDLGFGKIRMSSVGISVGIRYSPVLSRKRQH